MPKLSFITHIPDTPDYESLKRALEVYGKKSKEKLLQALIVQAAVLANEDIRNIGEIIDNNFTLICSRVEASKRRVHGTQ